MDDIYENIDEYNQKKKCKILIAVDDIIADMVRSKNLQPIVTELFIRGRKLNCITQSQFTATKNIRLNSTHFQTLS